MSDKELVLRIPHSLGAEEAKRRIASGTTAAKSQFANYFSASDVDWDNNRMTFRLIALAQTVRGTVDVQNEHVELRAHLPMIIRMLAKRIVPVIQETSQKLLTKRET